MIEKSEALQNVDGFLSRSKVFHDIAPTDKGFDIRFFHSPIDKVLVRPTTFGWDVSDIKFRKKLSKEDIDMVTKLGVHLNLLSTTDYKRDSDNPYARVFFEDLDRIKGLAKQRRGVLECKRCIGGLDLILVGYGEHSMLEWEFVKVGFIPRKLVWGIVNRSGKERHDMLDFLMELANLLEEMNDANQKKLVFLDR